MHSDGKKIIEQNIPAGSFQVTVNISGLQAGFYYLMVIDKNGKRYKSDFIKD